MPHAYTEDQLVEQPAIGLFAKLGWSTVSALEETLGATGTLLRETKVEVGLVSWLHAALQRLTEQIEVEERKRTPTGQVAGQVSDQVGQQIKRTPKRTPNGLKTIGLD